MEGRYGADFLSFPMSSTTPTKQSVASPAKFSHEMKRFLDDGSTEKINNWNDFCRAWRNGIRAHANNNNSGMVRCDNVETIAIRHHADVMQTIRSSLRQDGPPHVIFPGQKDSFVQLAAEYPCPRAYTLCLWLMIDESVTATSSFLLCRCRCPTGGLDIQLSDRQPDGRWTVTMKGSSVEEGSASNDRTEAKGSAYITTGRWHLLSIRHSYVRCSKISFIVDGHMEFENEVMYPFHISPVESQWVFGLGFRGLISSVSLYGEEIPLSMLTLLHGKGPHTASLVQGVIRTPQSSFESGHMTLGTQISKGPTAAKACRLVPILCITAAYFIPLANLPQLPPGRPNVDHIGMVSRMIEDSPNVDGNVLVPSMTGSCQLSVIDGVDSTMSQADALLAAGGGMLMLYLLQEYVRAVNARHGRGSPMSSSSSSSSSWASSSASLAADLALIHSTISLLATLLESSADLKEQFIQIHGFHIVGSCLSQLTHKRRTLSTATVDCCVELSLSLGADALKGDGVASALQGLLFDFRVWGEVDGAVKLHLLTKVAALVGSSGEQLFRCVGLQRLLDVLRLYVSHPSEGGGGGGVLIIMELISQTLPDLI